MNKNPGFKNIVYAGTATAANTTVWIVPNAAILDFNNSANPLGNWIGYEVEIHDSSGNIVTGYIMAVR